MAVRSNALSSRSVKGQSHRSAGTRNMSLEKKKYYNPTQTTWCAHDMVAHSVKLLAGLGREQTAKQNAIGPSSPLREVPS